MKNPFLAVLSILICLGVQGQNNFYRNILGDRMPYTNSVPMITQLDTTSEDGYIISASARPNAQYCSLVKLDSAFNVAWSKTYSTTPYAYIYNATQLDDKGYISVFVDSAQTYLLKTDTIGNIEFCKKHTLGVSGILSTGKLCKSSLNDSGFVAVYGACAMDFGLAKFDKYGETVWVRDYRTNGVIGGNVYDVHPAFNSGYICIGQEMDISTQQRSGILVHADNQGMIVESKRIQIDSAAGIHTGLRHITWSLEDTCYYVCAYTFAGIPFAVDHHFYMLKLDTALNVLATWKLSPPNVNSALTVNNFVVAPDGSLIVDGIMQDTVTSVYKFYMVKFDPITGILNWSKSLNAISSPQWYFPSAAINGIDFYGPNNDIVFPVFAGNDGNSLASMPLTGNGLCITVDTTFSVSAFTQYICRDFPISVFQTGFTSTPKTIPVLEVNYNDSLLCGNWTGLTEINQTQSELVTITGFSTNFTVQSKSSASLRIEVYSAAGQLVSVHELEPSETYDLYLPTAGVYLVRAYNNDESFVERVVNY